MHNCESHSTTFYLCLIQNVLLAVLQSNLLFNGLLFWKCKARFRVSAFLSGNISCNYTLPRNANFVHFFSKPDDTHLVVGMSNGLLSIRHHIKPAEDRQETPQGRVRPRGGTYRYFVRGKNLPSRQVSYSCVQWV